MDICNITPSYEAIIVARKPLEGSCVDNVMKYGVGGINIDECRVEPTNEVLSRKINSSNNEIYGKYNNFGNENNISDILGRFPANVILTYDDTDKEEVIGGMPYSEGCKPHRIYSNVEKYEGWGNYNSTEWRDSWLCR